MSQHYAEQKVREALKQTGGNTTHARQQVILWAQHDEELLKALAGPHLTGIVAYHIERVIAGRADSNESHAPKKAKKPPKSKQTKKQTTGEERFGYELLKTIAQNEGAVFGFENNGPMPPKQGVSKEHVDAVNKIIKNRNKK